MGVRLIMADPHPVAVAGVQRFVAGTEIEFVAATDDTSQLEALIAELRPDVLLLSVHFDGFQGLRVLKRLRREHELPIIVTSCRDHPAQLAAAYQLDATGMLLMSATKSHFIHVIRLATAGPQWSREDVRRVTGVLTGSPTSVELEAPLTARETQVVERIANGRSNREIAAELSVSYETVKEHVQHILRKIGVQDRTQAAVWAVRHGLA